MEYRKLGSSGMYISELAYGNWVTHGEQIDQDAATACVRQAVDLGITTFDTADAYAGTRAEQTLGEALAGERRQSVEIFTKVYFPTGEGRNDRGLSRKHIMESINGSLTRLGTDYVDLYQAHRYDYDTPLEETMQAFADIVRQGKALYIGVSEWTVDEIRAGAALARELGSPDLQPAPVLPALAGHRKRSRPYLRGVGPGTDLLVTHGPRRADRKISARPSYPGSIPLHRRGRRVQVRQPLPDRRHPHPCPAAQTARRGRRPVHGRPRRRLGTAKPQRLGSHCRRPDQLIDTATAAGVKLDPTLLANIDDILDPVVERDPAKVESFKIRP